jgi:hypothetical protein
MSSSFFVDQPYRLFQLHFSTFPVPAEASVFPLVCTLSGEKYL